MFSFSFVSKSSRAHEPTTWVSLSPLNNPGLFASAQASSLVQDLASRRAFLPSGFLFFSMASTRIADFYLFIFAARSQFF